MVDGSGEGEGGGGVTASSRDLIGNVDHLALQLKLVCMRVVEQALRRSHAVPRRLDYSQKRTALGFRLGQMLLHKTDALVVNGQLALQRRQPLLQRFHTRHPLTRKLNKMLRNARSISSQRSGAGLDGDARRGGFSAAALRNDAVHLIRWQRRGSDGMQRLIRVRNLL